MIEFWELSWGVASWEADVMFLVLVGGVAACGILHTFSETFEVCTPSFEAGVIMIEAIRLYAECVVDS